MCGATTGGLSREGIDVSKETVIEGTVSKDGVPVTGYVRLLNAEGEFTAEVPTSHRRLPLLRGARQLDAARAGARRQRRPRRGRQPGPGARGRDRGLSPAHPGACSLRPRNPEPAQGLGVSARAG